MHMIQDNNINMEANCCCEEDKQAKRRYGIISSSKKRSRMISSSFTNVIAPKMILKLGLVFSFIILVNLVTNPPQVNATTSTRQRFRRSPQADHEQGQHKREQQFQARDEEELVAPLGGHQLSADQFVISNEEAPQLDAPAAAALMAQGNNNHAIGAQASTSSSPLMMTNQQQQQKKTQIRTVNPGDRVNIPCSLANMGGSIQFAKDDQPIILDSACAHCQLDISNDGQASLTINRVSQRDQGHWQCWRLDAQGKVKQNIPIMQLVVTNSPELPILMVNDKELLGGNNLDATITIKENEIVNFKCVIKGASTPVDYVHWILDSNTNVTQMSQIMMEYSGSENNYLTQSVLKLNATKSMNMKSISCLSNHQLWLTPMTVTALLNVLYEPSFTISREPGFGVPVSEGMTVILKCEIDSNPSSSPVWIKDAENKTNIDQQQQQQQINSKEMQGEPIVLETQEDGSVIFQPARRQDSGWYRCKTENKYGNFSSFGYYLNVRPASTSGSATSTASSSQMLSNYIGQQNQHNNNHYQQQQQPQQQQQKPRSDSRIMSPNQPAAQVGGPNFQRQHQPDSSTLQRSQLANDQPLMQQQQLEQQDRCPKQPPRTVDGFPEIKNPVSTVQALLGRQLILPLRFCCNPGPARVFWIHRHLAMIPGRMFGPYITRDVYATYNSIYCYETTFEIESVKPEDIGTVYVFVSNEKGHAGAQIHIQLAKQDNQHYSNVAHSGLGSSRFSLINANNMGNSATTSFTVTTTNLYLLIALAILATCSLHQLVSQHNIYNQPFASASPNSENHPHRPASPSNDHHPRQRRRKSNDHPMTAPLEWYTTLPLDVR